MILRKEAPGPDNKYYLKVPAGYNPCILGNSSNRQYPQSVLANCVGGATGLFNEILNNNECKYLGNRNPDSMAALARLQGLEVGNVPRPGCACVQYGSRQHIFIIGKLERITGGYRAEIHESGWSFPPGIYWKYRTATSANNWGMGSAYTTRCYIYHPAINPYWEYPTVDIIKKGTRGNNARWMQWNLWRGGYYESGSKSEVDGIAGDRTIAALKLYQCKHGLEADGICGPLTRAEMIKEYCIE